MIVGLGCKARQGKDTAANFLAQKYGFKVYHFADALKEECRRYFGWDEKHKNVPASSFLAGVGWRDFGARRVNFGTNCGWCEKEKMLTPLYEERSLLQFWGEFMRSIDEDYWVRQLANSLALKPEHLKAGVVIADMRHKNEAKWVEKAKGVALRIVRLDEHGKPFIDPDRDPRHGSETDLDKWEMPTITVPHNKLDVLYSSLEETLKL